MFHHQTQNMEHRTWNIKWGFFGSDEFSITVLEELMKAGYFPALIITVPDQPKGRGLILTSPPIKSFAEKHGIPILQPFDLKDPDFHFQLSTFNLELFIVASYGKIIPKLVLDIPAKGVLNVHPSLLPKFRGSSPIQSAILNDEKNTGVTIMQMDEKMDHGPIVAQKNISPSPWPPELEVLEKNLAGEGGKLLVQILPDWIEGKISPTTQAEKLATYCEKFEKADGLINLEDDPYKNFLKIRALGQFPGTYFFADRKGKKIRVIIKDASFDDEKLVIKKVTPEGKKEMPYSEFLKGL